METGYESPNWLMSMLRKYPQGLRGPRGLQLVYGFKETGSFVFQGLNTDFGERDSPDSTVFVFSVNQNNWGLI